MGIPGLTTYINNQGNYILEDYALYDTNLIVDGNSLANQLYNQSWTYSSFGGDYDKFRVTVTRFFTELRHCNVVPLILMDGGTEDKKVKTCLRRVRDRIKLLHSYSIQNEYGNKVYPTLMIDSFKAALTEVNVKFAQTTFEADKDIAAIAKALQCPVLSFDSDFYIYDAAYIPFDTLINGITPRANGQGFAKHCKIYRVENLLRRLPGLDKSLLPLLAALLGNDYVNNKMFTKFFQNLKLPKSNRRIYNDQQRRIEGLLQFLRNHTLDSAITRVLARLKQRTRDRVLKSIELVINSYRVLSANILLDFGYDDAFVKNVADQIKQPPYYYDPKNFIPEENEEDDEDENEEEEEEQEVRNSQFTSENERIIYDILPTWFLKEFNMGHLPYFCIDFLTRQLYILSVQIGDVRYPATALIALPLIRIMYKLITTGVLPEYKPLTYIIRKESYGYEYQILECPEEILGQKFPSLHDLRSLPADYLREIINTVVGIQTEMRIEELPDSWQLYIAVMIYWMKQDIQPNRNSVHMYCMLFAMLFHIIDINIGNYRDQKKFRRNCQNKIREVEYKRQWRRPEELSMDVNFQQVISEVTEDDCLMAAPYFIQNFYRDQELMKNSKKYNLTTVHVFNMFQSCLKLAMYLNALLGFPYQAPMFNYFFNGTLLYNLYNNFKGRKSVDLYIANVLENAPSLLRLFKKLFVKVQMMCDVVGLKLFNETPVTFKYQQGRQRYANDLQI